VADARGVPAAPGMWTSDGLLAMWYLSPAAVPAARVAAIEAAAALLESADGYLVHRGPGAERGQALPVLEQATIHAAAIAHARPRVVLVADVAHAGRLDLPAAEVDLGTAAAMLYFADGGYRPPRPAAAHTVPHCPPGLWLAGVVLPPEAAAQPPASPSPTLWSRSVGVVLVRGVLEADQARYQPDAQGMFACGGGDEDGQRIPHTSVNDDYCDCADQSDEPGTAACPRGVFACADGSGRTVPSGRVRDGLRDCPDGSDEDDDPPVQRP
jgi:hypothetical protein